MGDGVAVFIMDVHVDVDTDVDTDVDGCIGMFGAKACVTVRTWYNATNGRINLILNSFVYAFRVMKVGQRYFCFSYGYGA